MYQSPMLDIDFSEPIANGGAATYMIEPMLKIDAVRSSADGRRVTLALASPPEVDRAYRVSILGARDTSPAANEMKPSAVPFMVHGPVFKIASVAPEQFGTPIKNVPNLPVKGGDSWTINMFVRTGVQPPNRTIIAGFGRCEQSQEGGARYLAKFAGGIHFWSHNRDVQGRTPLDLNRWQMLTATYDGRTLRLYKDGKRIAERDTALSDDEPTVCIAPPDPWEGKRRFQGEIREFTIWNAPLGQEAIDSLRAAASLP
jgi:alpha-mannosidase